MQIRRGRTALRIYGVLLMALALLVWLEWLGSEQPLAKFEVSVAQPVAKQKTGQNIED